MSTTDMEIDFARAVRTELAAIGTRDSRLQRHQRRTRALAFGIGAVALVGATTGAAIVVNNFPGSTTVAPLGRIASATHTGTGTIELGAAPAKAAVVIIDLTCVSKVGTISLLLDPKGSEGASGLETDCSIARKTTHITDGRLPVAGATSITITADPGTTWKATAQYATSATTAWGVNANGQTYGVANGNGLPDLEPARATNGKVGYIFSKDVLGMKHSGHINVYESDGTTVIGRFPIGNVDGWSWTSTHTKDAPTGKR